eukprot:TRINITY_DN13588_c0_g3_i3.p1 TRINITY_DN13588_c0_g3~~TRINITY_DN13588_c0_g3_i3.p1  ORF type:complete len:136 (-),score=33.02 TRINITY_DN13588_c0_g3_i3:418-825(-)
MSISPRKDFRQCSWVPKGSEEQLNLGLDLIAYAYTSRHSSLTDEIATLAAKVKELSLKLREAEDKAAESQLLLQDLTQKGSQLDDDREQMTVALQKLKAENEYLQNLANNVKSTISVPQQSSESPPIRYREEYFH